MWELARPFGRMYTVHSQQKKAGSPRSRDAEVMPCAQRQGACITSAWTDCHRHPTEARSAPCPLTHDTSNNKRKPDSAYRTAQERLARPSPGAHAAGLQQALDHLGLPEDLDGDRRRLRSQHKLLGKIIGVMCPPLFGCRTNTELCREAGIKICLLTCSGRCPSGPGSSGSDVWDWRYSYRYGATPQARVRPRAAAGNGPGWAMTQYSKSMANSWVW